tara:strand:- start:455 stop:820 length:366 start_codon:yes stop_codon:yes gene_type:complete
MMPKNKYTKKQMKIARVAEPRDEITGADFEVLRKAGGGMVRYQEGGKVEPRIIELEELLEAAREVGDQDKIAELESDLLKERGFKAGGRVKGFRRGMSVSVDGMGRGCGSAVKGKNFSGTY